MSPSYCRVQVCRYIVLFSRKIVRAVPPCGQANYLRSYIISVAVLAESLLEGYCLFLLRSWQEKNKDMISGWYWNRETETNKWQLKRKCQS